MIRLFDISFSIFGLLLTFPLFFLILPIIKIFDNGPILFFQERVGRNHKPFVLIKLRTMRVGTESIATHLADPKIITPIGYFLRRTKLDELPQLWNVLKGEMSLVGPRPCLFNQEDLIHERTIREIFKVRPGITGLAQIQKIDMSKPKLLAEVDAEHLKTMNLKNYLWYILLTLLGKGSGDLIEIQGLDKKVNNSDKINL